MTLLQPARRTAPPRVAVLGDADRPALVRLLDADPIVNAVASARVRGAADLGPDRFGGTLLGVWSGEALCAAAYHGATLVPIGGTQAEWTALAGYAAVRPRVCTSVVGAADAVGRFWALLERCWGRPRAMRASQPLLVHEGPVPAGAGDGGVRPVRREQTSAYLDAAAAMFVEELDLPVRETRRASFRARVAGLIECGRALAVFGRDGRVVFKADIGAVSPHTCQVQGVWVRPDMRGRGIATAAMGGVLRYALDLAPSVSLYVNDFNAPARRVYEKVGMRAVGTLATVLL